MTKKTFRHKSQKENNTCDANVEARTCLSSLSRRGSGAVMLVWSFQDVVGTRKFKNKQKCDQLITARSPLAHMFTIDT